MTQPSHKLALLISSVGGVGYLPIMPGTWGSLVVIVPALLLPVSGTMAVSYGVFAAVCIFASLWSIPKAQQQWGKDPSAVVIDEAAGMALMMADPLVLSSPWFRVYDVAKPYPIDRINDGDSALSVLADDLLAAVYGLVTVHVFFVATQYIMLWRMT
jgi:phosphatidylglycerophosphatase A